MIRIIKDTEPEFWSEYKKRHPGDNYEALDNSEEGRETRRMLRQHLIMHQKYICAYCSKRISLDESLNEHIKPQNAPLYAAYSMDYNNIVASCKTEGAAATCGARKSNKYDEKLFVSPLDEDCESHFKYYPDGTIEGTTEKGRETIAVLNLNSYKLKVGRKARYKECLVMDDKDLVKMYYIEPRGGKYESYADMVRYFYNKGEFDK